jgi:hypothetical protein
VLYTWNAERLEHVLTSGRTRPLVISCARVTPAAIDEAEELLEDSSDHKRFVVKALGHPEITEQNLFSELFGNLLARELDVATPRPYQHHSRFRAGGPPTSTWLWV